MAGIFIQKHIEAINTLHPSRVLFPMARHQKKSVEIEQVQINELIVYRTYYKSKPIGISFLDRFLRKWYYFKALKGGIRKIRKDGFTEDFVHLHVLERNAKFIKSFYNKPYFITEHWSKYLFPKNHSSVDTSFFVKSAGISVVSKTLKQGLLNSGITHKHIECIPNVVDTTVFTLKETPKNTIPQLVHVSEFNEEAKNISGILESLSILKSKGFDFTFKLVGYGKDLNQIKAKIKALELEPRVELTGKLYPEDLARILNSSDLFIFNSRYETFGIVILEALLCGCPVVSTKVGIAPEVIKDENGLLVEDNLKECIELALNSTFDRNIVAQSVKGQYDVSQIAQQFSDFYTNAFSKVNG